MTRPRTLRARVLLGAILWTIGFFAIITMVLTFSVHARDSVMVIHRHNAFSGCIAIVCMFAGLALVRGALIPLADMRQRLADVRAGKEQQLRGAYPAEVQPLVDDLNALLEHRDQTVRRAVA